MPRSNKSIGNRVNIDETYRSELVYKLINYVMHDGKRSIAVRMVNEALEEAARLHGAITPDQEKSFVGAVIGNGKVRIMEEPLPLAVLMLAIFEIYPPLEVRSRRVGGATYQIPVEVTLRRGLALALRWLVSAARSRSEGGMRNRLANEIKDAANKRGAAYKKRLDVFKMAEANRAFIHLRNV